MFLILVEFPLAKALLLVALFGAGKAAEHGSILAGLVALVAFALLEPRLLPEVVRALKWSRHR